LSPIEYWELTVGEFLDCLDGYQARLKDVDHLNHTLGYYVAIGFNSPKKYPSKPFLEKTNEDRKRNFTTDAQRQRYARLKYGKK
jgi:hypothetical protein